MAKYTVTEKHITYLVFKDVEAKSEAEAIRKVQEELMWDDAHEESTEFEDSEAVEANNEDV